MNDRGKRITQGLEDKTMVFASRQTKTSLRNTLLVRGGLYRGMSAATTKDTGTRNESSYKLDESRGVSEDKQR